MWKNLQVSQCPAGLWQLLSAMFYNVLTPTKKSHIHLHMWRTLTSQLLAPPKHNNGLLCQAVFAALFGGFLP